MLNNTGVESEKLPLRHILSVRCPVCRAKPKEKCTLSTGHPCVKTHHARSAAAAEAGSPGNFVEAALRILKAAAGRSQREGRRAPAKDDANWRAMRGLGRHPGQAESSTQARPRKERP
jgi:hypothetical protein